MPYALNGKAATANVADSTMQYPTCVRIKFDVAGGEIYYQLKSPLSQRPLLDDYNWGSEVLLTAGREYLDRLTQGVRFRIASGAPIVTVVATPNSEIHGGLSPAGGATYGTGASSSGGTGGGD